jgi:hypothetical protein
MKTARPARAHYGSHLTGSQCDLAEEILIGQANFVDVLAGASKRFGAKPILVICGDPGGVIGMTRAYDVGVELAAKLPFSRIAIALNERMSTSADRFTELVAEPRRWCGTSRP